MVGEEIKEDDNEGFASIQQPASQLNRYQNDNSQLHQQDDEGEEEEYDEEEEEDEIEEK